MSRSIAAQHGLDRPFIVQYLDWGWKALHGDLGKSLFTHEPVLDLILDRLPVTIALAFAALVLSLVVAVPLGVVAAIKPNTWIDRIALAPRRVRAGDSEFLARA